jgi:hypothetical protein
MCRSQRKAASLLHETGQRPRWEPSWEPFVVDSCGRLWTTMDCAWRSTNHKVGASSPSGRANRIPVIEGSRRVGGVPVGTRPVVGTHSLSGPAFAAIDTLCGERDVRLCQNASPLRSAGSRIRRLMHRVESAWLFCAAWVGNASTMRSSVFLLPLRGLRSLNTAHRSPRCGLPSTSCRARRQCSGRCLVVESTSRTQWRLVGAGAYHAGEITDRMPGG